MEAQSRHYLDVAGKVPLKPDIVWQVGDATVAVIDAKYKAEKPSGYPNADLYQLLTYCTVLGLRVGHLVYAAGNEQPARHVVREAYTEIICHALDLSQSPDALLGEVSSLAAHVAAERGIETQTSASQPLLPFSAALFEAWHNPSQWISARRRDRALSMSVIGAFSWRWPEGIESYEHGWVAIADVDGTQFQIRHGIGHRDAFGRSRIRTVTWVEGEPLVEGVEADDFDQSQALLSLIKITKKPCS